MEIFIFCVVTKMNLHKKFKTRPRLVTGGIYVLYPGVNVITKYVQILQYKTIARQLLKIVTCTDQELL